MSTHPERERLRQEARRTTPRRPGVYRLIDAYGQTVYIGKSVSLRDRLLSHLGSSGALSHGICKFETRETKTELLALLLEDALIKQELPRHNDRQAELADFRYIVLTSDPYPTCKVVEEAPADELAVFGPLRGKYFAAELIDIVNRTLGMRTCVDRRPFRRSANYDLGFCSGPCRGAISEGAYQEIVGRVMAFLAGDDTHVVQCLQEEISKRAEALDFEGCAERERLLERCRRFCARQRFIERFRSGKLRLFDRGDGSRYEFEAGRLLAFRYRAVGTSSPVAVPEELAQPVTDPRALLDRAAIVHGWLERHPLTCETQTHSLETATSFS